MPPKSKANPTAEILAFLLEKNRPYSTTNLVDEMHGEYSKGVIQKAVDALVEDGKITCKLCGKTSKLYFANQEGKEVATKEELAEMDKKKEELDKKYKALVEKREQLTKRRDELAATRTMDELRKYREQIEKKLQEETQRKDDLIAAAEGISPEDCANAEKMYKLRCEQWYKRRKLCMEIVDQLSEQMEKKPKEFMEDLELETDDQYHTKLEYKEKKYTVLNV